MNERIKELAEQAGFVLWKNESWNSGDVVDWSVSYDDELEKFVELIIRECSNIGEMKEQGYSQYDPDTSVGWYMRQHFGIKT